MAINFWHVLSNICGVIYVFAWNLSFYPQIYENYHRKNVKGFSVEYALLNPLGYFFYTIYNLSGTIDPYIGTGIVDWTDLFFAFHGLALSLLTLVQCIIYKSDEKNTFKLWCWVLITINLVIFLGVFIAEESGAILPKGA